MGKDSNSKFERLFASKQDGADLPFRKGGEENILLIKPSQVFGETEIEQPDREQNSSQNRLFIGYFVR